MTADEILKSLHEIKARLGDGSSYCEMNAETFRGLTKDAVTYDGDAASIYGIPVMLNESVPIGKFRWFEIG